MSFHNRPIALLFAAIALALTVSAVSLVRNSSAEEQSTAPAPNDSDPVELLFVQNAVSGTFDGKTLTLKGVGPTIFFSDRPYRIAGQVHTSEFMSHWDKGSDNFQENPPNAALSVFGKGDAESIVVELTDPALKKNTLSYKAKVLKGKLPASFKEASLFIDIFGRWRMYARGMAVGAAASSAAHYAYHAPAAPVVVATPAPVYTAPLPAEQVPPPAVNVTVTTPSAGTPAPASTSASQAAAIAKLKELKGLLSQGLISQAQYQEESQKLLNEIMQ